MIFGQKKLSAAPLGKPGDVNGWVGSALELRQGSIDEANRRVPWTLSQEIPDRAKLDKHGREAGDIVRVNGIAYKHFKKHGMPLMQYHDYSRHSVGIVLGESLAVEGDKFVGTLEFNPEGANPDADILWSQVKAKHLNTCSIGFIAWKVEETKTEDEEDGDRYSYRPRDFQKIYLLETSMTAVPMCQGATRRDGDMDEYDFRELARDIIGHNPLSRTPEGIERLIRRLGEFALDEYKRGLDPQSANAGDSLPPAGNPADTTNLGEPEYIAPVRKTIDELVLGAVSEIRSRGFGSVSA